jgi:hypothetical protein
MTIGGELLALVAGALVALYLHATISWIVAAIGIAGSMPDDLAGSRRRATV